jgi:Leucine-rich repeat (LRR) protein
MTRSIMQAELLPPSLEEIFMRSCGISVINCSPCTDPQQSMFPRLRTLNLSQNYLKDIPSCIMPSTLVTIDICNNFLSELPATLVSIPSLWNLFINENQICSLPSWISELERLRRFSIFGNPILLSPQQTQLIAHVQMSINLRELARKGYFVCQSSHYQRFYLSVY